MPFNSLITDKATGMSAEVTDKWDGEIEKKALIVATRPLKYYTNEVRFFTNDDYGVDMNQDTGALGSPAEVHNGTDDPLWTGTNIVGAVVSFASTEQNHTDGGTKSVKCEKENANDVYQFAKGSDLDCTSYVSLTMWIYVDKDWKAGDSVEVFGYDTGTGLQVGDAVALEDYFSYGDYDTWHKISIPLTDMGTLASYTTLDALRVKQASVEGKGPKYYLDDVQFEETGAPIAFTLKPDKGTWLYVEEFTFSFADAYTGIITVAGATENASLPGLSYNKLLGETLVSGIVYKREQDGETQFTRTIKGILDLLQLPHTEITAQGSDGTNSFVTIRAEHLTPLILKSENADKITWTISEDLSGLLQLRISAGCKIEQRE